MDVDCSNPNMLERAVAKFFCFPENEKVFFVRSQDQLALDSDVATGRRLSAWEVYQIFQSKDAFVRVLEEIREDDVAVLAQNLSEPAGSFLRQRERLGLSHAALALLTKLSEKAIAQAEDRDRSSPIGTLETLAQKLGMDERLLARVGWSGGEGTADAALATRLRTVRDSFGLHRPETTIMAFCEAAWVTQRQALLESWLTGIQQASKIQDMGFSTEDDYGPTLHPAWEIGYQLARKTRDLLNLPPSQPVILSDVVENQLAVPLVYMPLPASIAGATIASGSCRGIVVNTSTSGLRNTYDHSNVWIRRFTLAHELGHLLWDPDDRLDRFQFDKRAELSSYQELSFFKMGTASAAQSDRRCVEMRANAFAIEFLAPQEAVRLLWNEHGDLRKIMEHFGISYQAAKHHVSNIFPDVSQESLKVNAIQATDAWACAEGWFLSYPILGIPDSRRGRFAKLVAQGCQKGYLSPDSASKYLGIPGPMTKQQLDELLQFYVP